MPNPPTQGSTEDADRFSDERAAFRMTQAVREIGTAAALVRSTRRQAHLRELDELAQRVKRVRDEMYAEQGAIQHA